MPLIERTKIILFIWFTMEFIFRPNSMFVECLFSLIFISFSFFCFAETVSISDQGPQGIIWGPLKLTLFIEEAHMYLCFNKRWRLVPSVSLEHHSWTCLKLWLHFDWIFVAGSFFLFALSLSLSFARYFTMWEPIRIANLMIQYRLESDREITNILFFFVIIQRNFNWNALLRLHRPPFGASNTMRSSSTFFIVHFLILHSTFGTFGADFNIIIKIIRPCNMCVLNSLLFSVLPIVFTFNWAI